MRESPWQSIGGPAGIRVPAILYPDSRQSSLLATIGADGRVPFGPSGRLRTVLPRREARCYNSLT